MILTTISYRRKKSIFKIVIEKINIEYFTYH